MFAFPRRGKANKAVRCGGAALRRCRRLASAPGAARLVFSTYCHTILKFCIIPARISNKRARKYLSSNYRRLAIIRKHTILPRSKVSSPLLCGLLHILIGIRSQCLLVLPLEVQPLTLHNYPSHTDPFLEEPASQIKVDSKQVTLVQMVSI